MEETRTEVEEDCGDGGCCSGGCYGSEGGGESNSEDERAWKWLKSTHALQREVYGFDWIALGHDTDSITESLRDNCFAAAVELLGEVPREFSWKYWAHDKPFVNRDRLIGELVDVGHFIANMLVAVGCTDEEWEAAYQEKQRVNRQRQLDGYSAKKEQ